MADRQGFHAEMRALLEDRVLDAAAELIVAEGWGSVTMASLAAQVGVSRQLLYKQIGSRQMLGEAVVARETDRFLAGIADQLAGHPGDPVAGLSAATDYVLRTGAENALLKAIVAGGGGTDGDLLALLATRTDPVLQRTFTTALAHARRHYATLDLAPDTLPCVVEVFVRLTLSHLLQPTGPIAHAVAQVRAVVSHWLAGAIVRPGVLDAARP